MVHRRFSLTAPGGLDLLGGGVTYGADIPGEEELRLLGAPAGKRVLDLGCGAGANAVALARAGAVVIGVDSSRDQLALAREAAEAAKVRLELHHGPLAELAFLRADTVDACLSVFALATVADLDRVLRQVHRVLRPEAPLVLALPHPALALVDPQDPDLRVLRRWWDASPIQTSGAAGSAEPDLPRTISALFTSLHRAHFRLDTLAEPAPRASGPRSPHWAPACAYLPATLVGSYVVQDERTPCSAGVRCIRLRGVLST